VSDFFMENNLYHKYIDSPIGWLKLSASLNSLVRISFIDQPEKNSTDQPDILISASLQLAEYLKGDRKIFDIILNPNGTHFQKEVWRNVSKVDFGKTASYLNIAKQTDSEKNTRAVGMANGKNPIPIIIPCHRIIGSNGKLTGYAGGLERKRWLLHHELQLSEKLNLLF
jgi:methylated-DNA-[protein]-cysteine S-methyltransferase